MALKKMFYYLMKLHYSQTRNSEYHNADRFYYLMKLHYSQTVMLINLKE